MASAAKERPLPIEVVGSLNIDLVTVTPRPPSAGETLRATSFSTGFGGKGANQAVACARLSLPDTRVRMVGAVGDDQFGSDFLKHLGNEGINADAVRVVEGKKTGTSLIIVEEGSGENRILFSPGANDNVTPETVTLREDAEKGFVVLQLETPFASIMHSLQKAKAQGKETIFNPAPAVPIPDESLKHIDHLIVNETEAATLSGVSESELANSLEHVANLFISKGVSYVVITLGSKGVFWKTATDGASKAGKTMDAHRVKAVDTTAAGDTFVGAYTASLSRSSLAPDAAAVETAIEYANLAASLSVQKEGAQSSIPHLEEDGLRAS